MSRTTEWWVVRTAPRWLLASGGSNGSGAVWLFVAAISDRRLFDSMNSGAHRAPLQQDVLLRHCPSFRSSAGFQPALSRQDGGAMFKLGQRLLLGCAT